MGGEFLFYSGVAWIGVANRALEASPEGLMPGHKPLMGMWRDGIHCNAFGQRCRLNMRFMFPSGINALRQTGCMMCGCRKWLQDLSRREK